MLFTSVEPPLDQMVADDKLLRLLLQATITVTIHYAAFKLLTCTASTDHLVSMAYCSGQTACPEDLSIARQSELQHTMFEEISSVQWASDLIIKYACKVTSLFKGKLLTLCCAG